MQTSNKPATHYRVAFAVYKRENDGTYTYAAIVDWRDKLPLFFATADDARAYMGDAFDPKIHTIDHAHDGATGAYPHDAGTLVRARFDSATGWDCDGVEIDKWMEYAIDGREFSARVSRDDCMGEPWNNDDGHGIVSEWTSRDKTPGELVLNDDGRIKRYYDFSESVKIALRDGWGLGAREWMALASAIGRNPTKREIAARAARLDFEYLRAWCNDEWCYYMLETAPVCPCCNHKNRDKSQHLGGIAGMGAAYLLECVTDLAREIIAIEEKENAK